ncbi:MAG TPA: response regulator [Bacteroidota bacterium]|nr:response regulator [Bacteroidota bacterium]
MDILLVDDNEDYLFLVKQVLEQNGYTVHTAHDGIEGCEVLTKADIDLIISDIRMPRFDGLKLHAFAREIERYKKTKFIFVSGFRDLYSDVIKLDTKLDFLLDKTTPVSEMLKMVDQLIFGRLEGAWI